MSKTVDSGRAVLGREAQDVFDQPGLENYENIQDVHDGKAREFLRFYRVWPPSPWPRAIPRAAGLWPPGLGPTPYKAAMRC